MPRLLIPLTLLALLAIAARAETPDFNQVILNQMKAPATEKTLSEQKIKAALIPANLAPKENPNLDTIGRGEKLGEAANRARVGGAAAKASGLQLVVEGVVAQIGGISSPELKAEAKKMTDKGYSMLMVAGQWVDAAERNDLGRKYLSLEAGQSGSSLNAADLGPTGQAGASAGSSSGGNAAGGSSNGSGETNFKLSDAARALLQERGISASELADRIVSGEFKDAAEVAAFLGAIPSDDSDIASRSDGSNDRESASGSNVDAGTTNSYRANAGNAKPARRAPASVRVRREEVLLVSNTRARGAREVRNEIDEKLMGWVNRGNKVASNDPLAGETLKGHGIQQGKNYRNLFQIAHRQYRGFKQYNRDEARSF